MIYAVAMSGGVDSSVTAALLKEQGHHVIGFTMKHFDDLLPQFKKDSISKAIHDAKSVCHQIGIEHHTIDLLSEFENLIIKDFVYQYQNASTPNPCVICNPKIKWGLFPEKIGELLQKTYHTDDFMIATGHYARIAEIDGQRGLFRPKDRRKDQTYMLWGLNQTQLQKTQFPLFDHTKEEIRDIAATLNMEVSEKKDSQDICFVENTYDEFLKYYIEDQPGSIVFHDDRIIGTHRGLIHYTIGQRKGLPPWSKPLYVMALNAQKNQVMVTDLPQKLDADAFSIKCTNFIRQQYPFELNELHVKIRYNSDEEAVENIEVCENGLIVKLKRSVRAITPGQSAVFYRGDEVIGGGLIHHVY